MHEASLVAGILEIVEHSRQRHRFSRVNALDLSCGAMAGVDAEALRFAFDVQSRGTAAEGARLDIRVLPVRVYCAACDTETPVFSYEGCCPRCGSEALLSGGTESLSLTELDVD